MDFAGLPVFKGATVRTIVIISSPKVHEEKAILYTPPLEIEKFRLVQSQSLTVENAIAETTYEVPVSTLSQHVWSFATQENDQLIVKIRAGNTKLIDYCDGQICKRCCLWFDRSICNQLSKHVTK